MFKVVAKDDNREFLIAECKDKKDAESFKGSVEGIYIKYFGYKEVKVKEC
jgi:hypothetical protein